MAEIKISDLSIGDWVKASGVAKRVHSIDFQNGEYFVHFSDPDTNSEDYLHAPFVKPIPLTPEILEKNGLEYEDDGNDAVIFLCCDMFWARLCVGDTVWQVGIHSEDRLDAVVCNVKHTHQLQHALRLAGVGKEIEI